MKTYTKEQIVEAFKSALPNSTALGRLLTHLESLCGARNTSSGCSEVACTRTVGHTDTIPNVAQERHYNHERRVNWPAFKPGDHIRWPLSDHGWGYGVVKEPSPQLPDYWDIYIDGPKALCCFLHTSQLKLIPAQFKAGDRVRLVRTDGLGKLEFEFANKVGCIVSAGDISNDQRQLLTVRFDGKIRSFFAWRFDVVPESKFKPGDRVRLDNGSFQSVHASWLKSAPQFKDGQRVRVRVTGQAGRISGTNPAGDVLEVKYEGTSSIGLYKVEGLEPAPFKVGDRVRWRFGSSLPFCYGQVKYLSNERAGVRIDGQVVEVVEWLLEAEPLSVGAEVTAAANEDCQDKWERRN
jgi:hypothetical protein